MTADMPRVLDRKEAVPALVGDPADFLLISGLAGTGKDIGALTGEDHIQFLMTGAMGAAAMTGFGLALAQPDKQVLVVTGDAELLMGLGALATIGAEQPSNLAIV
ncbi:MAG: thiamine pyrophosphate-dependent enzyme, partial [Pseudomonadota bacterium]|nr:thiamine pyrophosphate-dependent enzyme [Pseudomonadota bacterium]